ncbi:MAG: 50S ribosomal protein L24 [Candidatus Thorarchaeota archaeon]|jgi:large subunit ribosomal protein L24
MKQKFSTKWKTSKQKRKQKKYRANAPLHIRRKMMTANLKKDLRKKYGRNLPVKKGDTVKITRGKFKGKSGKINNVNLRNLKVSIEGIQVQKKDGTKVNVYFDASKLQIQELNLEDKKRLKKPVEKEEVKEKEVKKK